ncbi:hypothetical protein QAD02_016134, partial [Eretmocerus hayati]
MANHDKGRRKWGEISQGDRSAAMRGGGNKPPSRALYRPGSGPLRKSGRSDDYDHETHSQDRPRISSVQDRMKPSYFSDSGQQPNSNRAQEIESITGKLNDIHMNSHDCNQSSSRNDYAPINDPRRRNKKPEQQLYVPKKVKEAMADHDVPNRSTSQNNWEKGGERPDIRDWEPPPNHSQSIRSLRTDNFPNRNNFNHPSGNQPHNGGRNREDHPKRFSGNRKNRNTCENDERRPAESPALNRNFGNRDRDHSRDARQGSEPLLITPNNPNDFHNQMRDTRSVEHTGYPHQFSGKPPSGRPGMVKEITMPKTLKLESLPPRLQAKYRQEHGLPPYHNTSIGTNSEDAWDGSTVTFKGSAPRFPPAMQQSQPLQSLPPNSMPPSTNWSNTIPGRGRGRGRHRPEEHKSMNFRPITPDQCSAPSSRSHTPSQEYPNKPSERRGSNSTMCTSVESLSRVDSLLMPPPTLPPGSFRSNSNRCQSPTDSYSRGLKPVLTSENISNAQRSVNAANQHRPAEKERPKAPQTTPENYANYVSNGPSSCEKTEVNLDWCEEVETSDQVETEQFSRSSSVMSRGKEMSGSNSQPGTGRGRGGKSKKKKKRNKDRSRDRREGRSRERQNDQNNRESDNSNNNLKSGRGNRRDSRRRNSHRSRESSKDRNYRGGSRAHDEFHRNRPSQNMEENWRAGRSSICESDDGRRISISHSTNSGPSSIQRHSPTHHPNSQPPGVLILPDQTQLSNSHHPRQQQAQQQKRTLFDPNNPNRPIIVTSPGSRPSAPLRNNEVSPQHDEVYHHGMQPRMHHGFQSILGSGVTDPYQYLHMGPSWYDAYSESFRSAKNPYLLLDIFKADVELLYLIHHGSLTSDWDKISYIRNFHHESLKTLLMTDLKFCQAENMEQHFWKIVYYNIIEILRKPISKDDTELREQYKRLLQILVDEGTAYFTSLLTLLETTYNFKLDTFLTSSMPPKGLGILGLALISAQKLFLFLGDLARYKELANESVNYGKSRQWYLKAQQINPKNGRPYSQLALLATYARRKLDAVYYYMRSLMASNPFPSARESLITMFDENRKKYESTERKRREERELRERARMKEKEGSSLNGGGLRREIWIHPGGKRMRRTTSASAASESKFGESDLEDLSQLTSVELNKRFVTSYLHVHGKLITKIG